MTPIQTLEIRAGEIRKRLADIAGMADLTDETRSELDKLKLEYTDNDSRQAALKIAGDAPVTHIETRSTQGREFRALIGKANVGEIFDAALSRRSVDGASAELQQHFGLDQNQIPLALLVRSWPWSGCRSDLATELPFLAAAYHITYHFCLYLSQFLYQLFLRCINPCPPYSINFFWRLCHKRMRSRHDEKGGDGMSISASSVTLISGFSSPVKSGAGWPASGK